MTYDTCGQMNLGTEINARLAVAWEPLAVMLWTAIPKMPLVDDT